MSNFFSAYLRRVEIFISWEFLQQVDCWLSSKRLRQNYNVTRLAEVWPYILVLQNHNVCYSSNHGPGVHNGLATRNLCLGVRCTIVEALDHFSGNNFTLFLLHHQTDTKYHQDVVDSINTHSIKVWKNVAACNSTLHIRILNQGVKEISGWDESRIF